MVTFPNKNIVLPVYSTLDIPKRAYVCCKILHGTPDRPDRRDSVACEDDGCV